MGNTKIRYKAKKEPLEKARNSKRPPITQKQMAELINSLTGEAMNRPNYAAIENGARNTSQQIAVAISQVVNKDINELFEVDVR